MPMKSIAEADVAGKRVLVRADFDVPVREEAGHTACADDQRLQALVPTLELLAQKGAKEVTLIAHLGRPGGKVDEALRLEPVAAHLRSLTKIPFTLRENLRFDPREEANDESFAKELAALGDIYVNEAFANSHRAHASMVGVPKLLPSFAGLRLVQEVERAHEALQPASPSLAIFGGAKFETKEPLMAALAGKYDNVCVGGVLGNDLLKARGMPVGASRVGDAMASVELASNQKLTVPVDLAVVEEGKEARAAHTADVRKVEAIVDIGPSTAQAWSALVAQSKFVLWNGPVGFYEGGYTYGTDALAQAIANGTCRALIGGGDTIAAVRKFTFDESRVFLSTGGGALLDFLADGKLPALEALEG